MSTTPAPRSLLTRLVDDAALFPPASTPVPQAWSGHLALRAGKYGDLLGPLLIGTSAAATLAVSAQDAPPVGDLETGTGHGPEPIDVGVIARAGTDIVDLIAAVEVLRACPHTRVVSVEAAFDAEGQWRRALDLAVPVAVEVVRDAQAQSEALDEVAAAADQGNTVLAKLRTQSTATAPVPSARELAQFLLAVRERNLPFKLTGGLHHAVARTVQLPEGGTEDQHGVLNLLLATHHLQGGAGLPKLQADLETRDAAALAAVALNLPEEAISHLRARFVSFGCCGVTEPLEEMTELGLITRPPREGA
ncbi:MAG: hypothetical protein Q4P07_10130 [Ornithinimicrobium sp.]|uniref:hypothetical protein n=1 Tax=Ornithinimicrobium sp. TaxID=1977084 RepID=UPI0026DF99AB|nr:hypothetical protein [Ornithinimicrobium sp.]MDO5740492.1 hypothetical protein [Ornithinimicrobium sp.]